MRKLVKIISKYVTSEEVICLFASVLAIIAGIVSAIASDGDITFAMLVIPCGIIGIKETLFT